MLKYLTQKFRSQSLNEIHSINNFKVRLFLCSLTGKFKSSRCKLHLYINIFSSVYIILCQRRNFTVQKCNLPDSVWWWCTSCTVIWIKLFLFAKSILFDGLQIFYKRIKGVFLFFILSDFFIFIVYIKNDSILMLTVQMQ